MDFPSAWLVTREHLKRTHPPHLWGAHNIEANIMQVISHTVTPKTSDFFDFFGLHLSFWADPDHADLGRDDEETKRVQQYLDDRLAVDIAAAQQAAAAAASRERSGRPELQRSTLALLPFASGKYKSERGLTNAVLFLNATFWSLQRYFDSVITGACDAEDYSALQQFPAWRSVKLEGPFCTENSGMYLLDHVHKNVAEGRAGWEKFRYFYFTEGDIMLYMRNPNMIASELEKVDSMMPHRLDALPIPSDFPALSAPANERYRAHLACSDTPGPIREVSLDEASCCFAGHWVGFAEFWWATHPIEDCTPNVSCKYRAISPSGCADLEQKYNIMTEASSVRLNPGGLPFQLVSHGAEVCEVTQLMQHC